MHEVYFFRFLFFSFSLWRRRSDRINNEGGEGGNVRLDERRRSAVPGRRVGGNLIRFYINVTTTPQQPLGRDPF